MTVGIDSREDTFFFIFLSHFRTKLNHHGFFFQVDIANKNDDANHLLHGNRLPWVEWDTEDTTCVVARHEFP